MKNKILVQIILLLILGINPGNAQSQWNLLGNATTNPLTDFVGTTDAKPFNITTNNGMTIGGAQSIYFNSNGALQMALDAFGNLNLANASG